MEQSQRTDRDEFWAATAPNTPELELWLTEWPHYYNWARPHGSLNGQRRSMGYMRRARTLRFRMRLKPSTTSVESASRFSLPDRLGSQMTCPVRLRVGEVKGCLRIAHFMGSTRIRMIVKSGSFSGFHHRKLTRKQPTHHNKPVKNPLYNPCNFSPRACSC